MPTYAIFGGCLQSDLAFPELRRHDDAAVPDWVFEVAGAPLLEGDSALLGRDEVAGHMHFTLSRLPGGFRLEYSDSGTFDIPDSADRIVWHPGREASVEAARLDVIGYGFATLFHAAGALCLHGSAVEVAAGALAFVAPKGYGKSTLAQALLATGARLATDDTIVVELAGTPSMRPGVHQVRLRDDSAARLVDAALTTRPGLGAKHVVVDLPDERLMLGPAPLAAVYVLSPTRAAMGAAAERDRLPPLQAALALIRETKGALLLGGAEAAVVLERAVWLAERIPVYRLRIARDFARLDEAVARILEWHGGVPDARVPQLIGSVGG